MSFARTLIFVAAAAAATITSTSMPATRNSLPAKLTVGIIGDFGWNGYEPVDADFCDKLLAELQAEGVDVPKQIVNDCDPGDRAAGPTAAAEQRATSVYVEMVSQAQRIAQMISVGDGFYDSGVDFTSDGINRFYDAFVNLYGGYLNNSNIPWRSTLGNHDIIKGYPAVTFQTQIAPRIDDRWHFGSGNGLPYYTYDIKGADWSATFVHIDTDPFIDAYQLNTSVYYNDYVTDGHRHTDKQVNFVAKSFKNSKATWKFLVMHHPLLSSSGNYTELNPLGKLVSQHKATILNGHDHCLAHYQLNGTNHVLSGGGGYAEVGDCNNGVAIGPYAKFLGANANAAANGFVTLDITSSQLTFNYWTRNSKGYPVANDMDVAYSFKVTEKSV